MSLLSRNELRLRIGTQQCEASLWRRGIRARCTGQISIQSADATTLDRALDGLLGAGHELPSAASICVEDEYLYYATLPASGAWRASHQRAEQQFAEMVDDDRQQVEMILAPGGRRWLAVALAAGLAENWRQALAARGIALRHLRPALFEDLRRLPSATQPQQGAVVMMRRQGATIVGLRAGAIDDIAWERCEVDDPKTLLARVRGFLDRLSRHDSGARSAMTVVVVPSDERQQTLVEALVAEQGWRMQLAGRSA